LLIEGIPAYTTDALEEQLEQRSDRLFCQTEHKSAVEVVEQLTLCKG